MTDSIETSLLPNQNYLETCHKCAHTPFEFPSSDMGSLQSTLVPADEYISLKPTCVGNTRRYAVHGHSVKRDQMSRSNAKETSKGS